MLRTTGLEKGWRYSEVGLNGWILRTLNVELVSLVRYGWLSS